MRRTAVLAVSGWLAAAAAATVAGVTAVTLVGRGLGGEQAPDPLSQREIAASLAAVTPTAGASPTATVSPTVGGPTGAPATTAAPGPAGPSATLLSTPGGTVIARCVGGRVTLVQWSPAPGYAIGEVRPGPDSEARVAFERGGPDGDDAEVEARVSCGGDGVPRIRWQRD
jgi:hypothetical protein